MSDLAFLKMSTVLPPAGTLRYENCLNLYSKDRDRQRTEIISWLLGQGNQESWGSKHLEEKRSRIISGCLNTPLKW